METEVSTCNNSQPSQCKVTLALSSSKKMLIWGREEGAGSLRHWISDQQSDGLLCENQVIGNSSLADKAPAKLLSDFRSQKNTPPPHAGPTAHHHTSAEERGRPGQRPRTLLGCRQQETQYS